MLSLLIIMHLVVCWTHFRLIVRVPVIVEMVDRKLLHVEGVLQHQCTILTISDSYLMHTPPFLSFSISLPLFFLSLSLTLFTLSLPCSLPLSLPLSYLTHSLSLSLCPTPFQVSLSRSLE